MRYRRVDVGGGTYSLYMIILECSNRVTASFASLR